MGSGDVPDDAPHPVVLEDLQQAEAGDRDDGWDDDFVLADADAVSGGGNAVVDDAGEEEAAGEGKGGGEEHEHACLEGRPRGAVVHDLGRMHEGAAEVEEGEDQEAHALDVIDVAEGEQGEGEDVVADHVNACTIVGFVWGIEGGDEGCVDWKWMSMDAVAVGVRVGQWDCR